MKSRSWFLFIAITVSLHLWGQTSWAQAQQAIIINEGSLVYTQPDFDAEVLTELKAGGVYSISLKTKGPFYKIRIKPKVTGWIADTDVKVGKFTGGKGAAAGKGVGKDAAGKGKDRGKLKDEAASQEPEKKEPTNFLTKKRKRPFFATRFRGPEVAYLAYAEDTMGALRTQSMPFYGMRVEGPNTIFTGALRTNAEFLFHPGAPAFYQSLTGQAANGWIFLTDFIFETALPQSPWHMLTFGFGPMFKYTHYEVGLLENGRPLSYSLDDMTLGAVFDVGLGFKISSYALRFNVKYHWEKTKYFGGAITFGFPF